jgi:hypothetical protein
MIGRVGAGEEMLGDFDRRDFFGAQLGSQLGDG